MQCKAKANPASYSCIVCQCHKGMLPHLVHEIIATESSQAADEANGPLKLRLPLLDIKDISLQVSNVSRAQPTQSGPAPGSLEKPSDFPSAQIQMFRIR